MPSRPLTHQVDDGHPTLAGLALDAAAAFEGSVQAGDAVPSSSTSTKEKFSPLRPDKAALYRASREVRRPTQHEWLGLTSTSPRLRDPYLALLDGRGRLN